MLAVIGDSSYDILTFEAGEAHSNFLLSQTSPDTSSQLSQQYDDTLQVFELQRDFCRDIAWDRDTPSVPHSLLEPHATYLPPLVDVGPCDYYEGQVGFSPPSLRSKFCLNPTPKCIDPSLITGSPKDEPISVAATTEDEVPSDPSVILNHISDDCEEKQLGPLAVRNMPSTYHERNEEIEEGLDFDSSPLDDQAGSSTMTIPETPPTPAERAHKGTEYSSPTINHIQPTYYRADEIDIKSTCYEHTQSALLSLNKRDHEGMLTSNISAVSSHQYFSNTSKSRLVGSSSSSPADTFDHKKWRSS